MVPRTGRPPPHVLQALPITYLQPRVPQGPLHIPAVCWEEATALPHRDSALPAPARAEETYFVHTIISLAAPIHWLSHYPPLLSMEPALGPGVQVNSKSRWRFQGKGGLLCKDPVALTSKRDLDAYPTVCGQPGAHSTQVFQEVVAAEPGKGARAGYIPKL